MPGIMDDEPDENDIDCKYTSEIVCPYCGHEKSDSWEVAGSDEVFDSTCEECGKDFEVTRDISVTYCTEKKPE